MKQAPGRSIEVTTDEMIHKIHDIVLVDRRMNIREIVEIVGISSEPVQNIVHEYLGMTKLSARWVPRLLTVDNNRNRMTTSKQCFELFKSNPKKFLRRFVTVDETWIPSLHARNERRVKTVDITRQTITKEGKDNSIGRKGHRSPFSRTEKA
jgi:histone-lysine N-methyltransferase SETMAR